MHIKLLFTMTGPTSYASDSNFTSVLPMLCTSHTNLEVKNPRWSHSKLRTSVWAVMLYVYKLQDPRDHCKVYIQRFFFLISSVYKLKCGKLIYVELKLGRTWKMVTHEWNQNRKENFRHDTGRKLEEKKGPFKVIRVLL